MSGINRLALQETQLKGGNMSTLEKNIAEEQSESKQEQMMKKTGKSGRYMEKE